jgi:preprotein translocase subunit SecD
MYGFPRWKVAIVFLVTVFGIYFSLPNFMSSRFLPETKLNLGLDLQGGSQLLLEVDYKGYEKDQMEFVLEDMRKTLRSDKVGYLNLSVSDSFVKFDIRDKDRIESTIALIRSQFQGMDVEVEGSEFRIRYTKEAVIEKKTALIEQSREIIRRRVDETGTTEPSIQRQGDARILLQVPGAENPEEIKKKIATTAKLTFHMVKEGSAPERDSIPSPGYIILPNKDGGYLEIEKTPKLSGESLVDAQQSYDQYGRIAVAFKFDNRGGKIFGDLTRDNVGRRFASVLDNVIVSAPNINEPILGGSGVITGNFTVAEATNLGTLLRAGALPASLKVMEERTVGASLGSDSIEAGKMAAMIGTALVAVYMILTYGFFGLVAVFAVVLNLVLIVAFMSLIHATLTLPGIAGMVLTVGMAVDANILIFERIREEIRTGKKPYACIEQGFARAFSTILDSNITTIIIAMLLYFLGTGTIKGFAVSLIIGLLCSMFTAVLVSRMIITYWLSKKRPKELRV